MKKTLMFAALAIAGAAFGACTSDPPAQASSPSRAPTHTREEPATQARARLADAPVAAEPVRAVDEPKKDVSKKEEPKGTAAEIGKAAPDISLQDLDGKTFKLSDYKGKLVVLEWFSPKCPMCVWAYGEGGPLHGLPERLQKEGIVWLAVNSEDPANEAAKVEVNKKFLEANKAEVTVLLDPSGTTGKAYGAKTTPHMFVIDEKGVLRYRGALDNGPRGNVPKGESPVNYVQRAIDELKAGKAVSQPETKSYG